MFAPTTTLFCDRRIILTCTSLTKAGAHIHLVGPAQISPEKLPVMFPPGVTFQFLKHDFTPETGQFSLWPRIKRRLASPLWSWLGRCLQHFVPPAPAADWVKNPPTKYQELYHWEFLLRLYKNGLRGHSFFLFWQLGPFKYLWYRRRFWLDGHNYGYFVKALEVAEAHKIDFLYAHDLWSLPAAAAMRDLLKVPLVYDTHEVASTMITNPYMKKVCLDVERGLYEKTDRFLTVNESVADYYDKIAPGIQARVIVNSNVAWAGSPAQPTVREKFRVPADLKLGVFVSFLNVDLGVSNMIRAVAAAPDDVGLLMVGDGVLRERYMSLATELGVLNRRIFFAGAVPYSQVVPVIAACDFGIIPCIQKNFNNGMNSSAKMYDYIQAALPVLSDAGVEIKKVMDRFGIGTMVDFSRPVEEIGYDIGRFAANIDDYKSRLPSAKKHFVWPDDFTDRVLGAGKA